MCPSPADKWAHKMWYAHTKEYHVAIRDEALIRIQMWTNLEKHHTEGKKPNSKAHTMCDMIPLIGNIQNRQVHRDRKQVSGCQGLGEGESLTGMGFLLG